MSEETVDHWQRVYAERDEESLSWTEAMPEASLALIEEAGLRSGAAFLDIGGGTSRRGTARARLPGHNGRRHLGRSDRARQSSPRRGGQPDEMVEADVRNHDFGCRFDLWHDRAVFHFMVDPADQDRYLTTLGRTLKPGGHLIPATFGPGGPDHCSGLPVDRYDAAALSKTLEGNFELASSRLRDHRTPKGGSQQFLYAHLRRLSG